MAEQAAAASVAVSIDATNAGMSPTAAQRLAGNTEDERAAKKQRLQSPQRPVMDSGDGGVAADPSSSSVAAAAAHSVAAASSRSAVAAVPAAAPSAVKVRAAAAASSAAAAASPPLFVAIIGGGLAGLSCALSLQRVGIRCRVFERDESFGSRAQGFGLTLTNAPSGALAQLGVLEQCLRQDCPSECHWVFDCKGAVLGYYGRAFLTPEELLAKRAREAAAQAAAVRANIAAPQPRPAIAIAAVPLSEAAPIEASPAAIQVAAASAALPVMRMADPSVSSSAELLPLPSPSMEGSPLPSPSPSASPPLPSPSLPAAASSTIPGWTSSANLRIPRQDLRGLLYERLLPDTVQWGARLQDYTENADGVELRFQDGSTLNCSMLVGADGIHSFVRRLQDTKCNEKVAPLRYLGVAAIIGLSPAMHPLLDAQGFYTMGPRARLFTMPFRPAVLAADGSGRVEQPPLTMWQLSFAEEDEAKARALKASPPEDLLAHALQRTSGWMAPVLELLSASPLANVWAIALYDRDARRLRTKQQASRVTVVGDACHPMSMFKGQGANQSLQDGPLLAKVLTLVDKNTPASLLDAAGRPLLTREALLNRVRRFEAQMVQRAAHRVLASREAARALHAPEASLLTPACGELYGIGGVNLSVEQTTRVLVRASEKKIGAPLADQLDSVFAQLLDETVPRDQRVAAKSKANCGMAANDM